MTGLGGSRKLLDDSKSGDLKGRLLHDRNFFGEVQEKKKRFELKDSFCWKRKFIPTASALCIIYRILNRRGNDE